MSDINEYTPWEQYGETELAYYKRLYLEKSAAAERLREAECAKCCRSLPPDGDCYGCQSDRLQAVVTRCHDILELCLGEIDPEDHHYAGLVDCINAELTGDCRCPSPTQWEELQAVVDAALDWKQSKLSDELVGEDAVLAAVIDRVLGGEVKPSPDDAEREG